MIYNNHFQLNNTLYPYLFTHMLVSANTCHHHHDFYEFVYIEEGSATNIIDNQEYILGKADFSLIVPGENHKIITQKDCIRRDICIPKNTFEELCNLILPQQFLSFLSASELRKSFPCPVNLILPLKQKLDYFFLKQDKSDTESKLLAYSILTEIFTCLLPKENNLLNQNIPEWLNTILFRFQKIEYLQQGLPAILEDINYNSIYINRIFKQHMGMSLNQYLSETRLNLSLMYLKTTTHSVNEISDILGFSSPSFFYKKFNSKYGVTPAQYRLKNTSNHTILL